MIFAVIEGLVLSFVLLLICVVNISNGPVGGVHYYEPSVQKRVVEMGLITEKEIKCNLSVSSASFFVIMVAVCPLLVFFANGASGFTEGFIQLTVCYLICGAFDRIFIACLLAFSAYYTISPAEQSTIPSRSGEIAIPPAPPGRHGIVAVGAERVAPQNPPEPKQQPLCRAMHAHRLNHVVRAGRLESACASHNGT